MITYPHCKINLGLHVTGKRKDGFHNIESVFLPIPLRDVLEIVHSEEEGLILYVSGVLLPSSTIENICFKAWKLLEEDYKLKGKNMFLHKIIPTGAGLGGGSADGAFALKLINDFFQLNISKEKLLEYAAHLGSDCPFFIEGIPSFVSGRGEIMEPVSLDLQGIHIAIIHPGIHISTADAYKGMKFSTPQTDLRKIGELARREWPSMLTNDFEEGAIANHPVIGDIKSSFYETGAFYASMSGSGSAVYGLFEKEPVISERFSEYFSWKGML